MESENGPSAAPATPTHGPRTALQPGQLSKPEKVWVSSSALIIGFYQAAPYSDAFKIFYKKSGAVFGTQVTLTPASILGPELAVRQPMVGEVQYFEYEIKKLKPSNQYVIKIKTGDDAFEVRSEKMGTVSLEEERNRDNDMRNFVGALVKLGEYDGLVLSYTPATGIFAVRILQIDDVASSRQLARLTSDYTDNAVPVQAYTLSQVRFGRWGGAITGSKVVNEGELKWLVARAVQMSDKSEAAVAFEARQRLLQAQVEKVTAGLEAEWANRFRNLKLRAAMYLLMLLLVAVAGGCGMSLLLGASGRRQRELEAGLAASGERVAEVEAELQMLHLYRVSLELDIGRRMTAASSSTNSSSNSSNQHCSNSTDSSTCGYSSNTTCNSSNLSDSTCRKASWQDTASDAVTAAAAASAGAREAAPPVERKHAKTSSARSSERRNGGGGGGNAGSSKRARNKRSVGGTGIGGGSSSSRRAGGAKNGGGSGGDGDEAGGGGSGSSGGEASWVDPAQLWGLPQAALRRAMARGRFGRVVTGKRRNGDGMDWAPYGGGDLYDNGHGGHGDEQPDAWTFINYVSAVYAVHLQEWMKVQLQKTVRHKVNEMLLPEAAANGTAYSGEGDSNSSARESDGSRSRSDGSGVGRRQGSGRRHRQDGYDSGDFWGGHDGYNEGYDVRDDDGYEDDYYEGGY